MFQNTGWRQRIIWVTGMSSLNCILGAKLQAERFLAFGCLSYVWVPWPTGCGPKLGHHCKKYNSLHLDFQSNRLLWLILVLLRDFEPVVSWNKGTPSHHPFIDEIFHYKPSIHGGTPIDIPSFPFEIPWISHWIPIDWWLNSHLRKPPTGQHLTISSPGLASRGHVAPCLVRVSGAGPLVEAKVANAP